MTSEPEHPQTGRPAPRRWSETAILEALRGFYREHLRAPTSTEWKTAGDDHPTYITVRERFGSWAAALDAAGLNDTSSSGTIEQLLRSVEVRIDHLKQLLDTAETEREGLIIALEHVADTQR
jgi:hypothetical protein